MFDEKRATSVRSDAKADTITLDVAPSPPGAGPRVTVTVLLDAGGKLVGVDLGDRPDHAMRTVVMVGRHEDVSRTCPAQAEVTRDARGDVARVVVRGARAAGLVG